MSSSLAAIPTLGADPPGQSDRRWRVLALVSVGAFMASLDLFIVNIAFPSIALDFRGSSVSGLSWVLNAYAIVFAALLVPAGRLADRYGRKAGFLVGLGVFALGSALCGAAPSVGALVAARVLQAAGGAVLMPTSLALLLPEFAPSQRAGAIGIWAGVGAVAAAAGPPLGGLLVQASWRLVFLVNVPVAIGAGIYALRLLHETRDGSQRLPDLPGTALLIASVGTLALGLVKASDWGWSGTQTLACLGGAAVGLAVFVVRCARHPSPVVDLAMLRIRSFALSNASMFVFSMAFAVMLLSNVLFLTGVWHDSVLKAGLSLSPGPLMAAALAVPSGRVANRIGQRYLAALGCLLFALSAAWWLWRITPTPDYAGALLPGLILSGMGVGMVLPSLSSAAVASLPPARFATGSAVVTMGRQLGSVLGVSVLVAIAGAHRAHTLAAFQDERRLMLAAALLAGVLALAIGRVRQREPVGTAAPAAAASGSSADVAELPAAVSVGSANGAAPATTSPALAAGTAR